MPYINHHGKDEMDLMLASLKADFKSHRAYKDVSAMAGTLNYVITKLLLATLPSEYSDFNALVGVLECCKLEFYRRAVAAYEDKKIEQNGDVYPVPQPEGEK